MNWPWVRRARLALAELALESARDLHGEVEIQLKLCRADAERLRAEVAATREMTKGAHEALAATLQHAASLTTVLDRTQGVLVEAVVALKREGFVAPPSGGDIQTEPALPTPVADAIEERAAGNPELQRALGRWARGRLRTANADDASIAQEILDGASADIFEG